MITDMSNLFIHLNWVLLATVNLHHAFQLPTGCQKISAGLLELSNTMASSPWRFSAILAHYFGLDVAPPGLYNTLKLALLLSLMQTTAAVNDTFQNLDLLAVTTDTLILDR